MIENDEGKLYGVAISKKNIFQNNFNTFCRKTSQKLPALASILTHMEKPQLELT